jgi:hypothetical protein
MAEPADPLTRSPRQRTFKGGSISFEFATGIECTIRNLSETGACLAIESTVAVPDSFTLIIKPEGTRRSCQVAWRSSGRIGVRFL